MAYPQGGMTVTNNDVSAVAVFDVEFDQFIFEPPTASITYVKGMLLAWNLAHTKLQEYIAAAGDLTGVPVAVLGSDVVADSGPSDVNLSAIVFGQVDASFTHTLLAGAGVALSLTDKQRLRDVGIRPYDVQQLALQDNQ